ncbi:hypothetical protein BB560_002410 [Smittium megazygosporum]|uniref:Uncharacterized protein n=2 Tax=Smittium megazygosporum TaxID=133381 RepID=A0A2T9ZEV7_9FUNG|nr:hypothetical protein BB560_002410 [Smittium megazygosporum]
MHKKLPKEKFIESLIWGYGSRRCPFYEYAYIQMKILMIVLIRNYKIYNNQGWVETRHPGYSQCITVVPNTDYIYIKRRIL